MTESDSQEDRIRQNRINSFSPLSAQCTERHVSYSVRFAQPSHLKVIDSTRINVIFIFPASIAVNEMVTIINLNRKINKTDKKQKSTTIIIIIISLHHDLDERGPSNFALRPHEHHSNELIRSAESKKIG